MDPMSAPAPKKSRRLLWIGVAVVVVLLVATLVAYLVIGNSKEEVATNPSPSSSPEATVATNDEVKQDLSLLDAAAKQAAADQAAAKAALKDGSNQIKVGN